MAVNIGPALSLVAQRIVLAPPSISEISPSGKGTPQKRYREGLITEQEFAQEMQSLGYSAPAIEQALTQAKLEREFDLFSDKLSALQVAYDKDIISYEQLKSQLLELVPDQPKALQLLELYDFRKRPQPKAVTAEKVPTLTVSQLLAAYRAGALGEDGLKSELAERGYSTEDIIMLVSTESAKLAKPTTTAQKQLTLAQLSSLLALGIISPDEYITELLDRNYSEENAARLLGLEMIKINARAA